MYVHNAVNVFTKEKVFLANTGAMIVFMIIKKGEYKNHIKFNYGIFISFKYYNLSFGK